MSHFRTLYPEIEPYRTGYLQADHLHSIYWEESGNPQGQPVIFLHGGPGSGTNPGQRRFFDPSAYRIILMDQRGCGKSTPYANLERNTTWDLVSDIELLRVHCGISRWVVFGGSWGSTLSLAYAETHPERVKALILRGIFLCRQKELHWFYQFGAHHIFTDEWEKFFSFILPSERGDLVAAYYKRLTSSDKQTRKDAAHRWAGWEAACLRLIFDPLLFAAFTSEDKAESIARIECHYFMNRAFFKTDNWLIENLSRIRSIPGVIIQGRYDIVCPFESAWELHRAWPEAAFHVIADAGHMSSEPGIQDALIRATDQFRSLA